MKIRLALKKWPDTYRPSNRSSLSPRSRRNSEGDGDWHQILASARESDNYFHRNSLHHWLRRGSRWERPKINRIGHAGIPTANVRTEGSAASPTV
ncbi:unnamed protein product [Trichogramma brassicae]|uniref:Uncharacterized protein n=1 Tax=Trichogramma brassicae TaxID=86971 RepID=A0A6H5HYI5_9HYME|nr:unnamed protein product [Trichogramma brassicae]